MASTTGKRAASITVTHTSNLERFPTPSTLALLPKAADEASQSNSETQPLSRNGTTQPLSFSVVPARPGEHVVARQLLASLLRGPSQAEYQAQLDDPFHEPTDRLLCKIQDFLVGHVRLVKREMRFGSSVLPIAVLADVLVLPEFRGQGCGSALLAAAEQTMKQDGTILAMVRTKYPKFFLQRGWCVWTRHSFSLAGAREILSRLLESQSQATSEDEAPPRRYNIRLWRHIEQSSLIDIYQRNTRDSFGPLIRSEAYWQWLLSRHAFDRIYVAIDGPDRLDIEASSPIVGYAVMKDGRILELMSLPDHPEAARQLLARACSDAIEQDAHYVRLDAPVGDPLHHVVARAGGELGYHESVNGEVTLVRLLDEPRMWEELEPMLLQRAKSAGLTLPLELGFQVDGRRQTLELRPRSVRMKNGRSCRSFLQCSFPVLTQMLLGHLDVGVALASRRIVASTRVAAEAAAALFPKLALWRPPWDEAPAP